MKKTFIIIILFLLCAGVFGVDVKSVKVMSGDSVTLKTDLTDIQEDDVIWWRFGEGESKSLLAEIVKHKIWYASGRFRDKLQISDSKSGDLTIMNMKIKYSGLYEAEINIANGASTSYKRFNVIISASPPVIHSGPGDAVSFTVMEGESVTLPCNAQTQRDAFILWRFGDERALIAEVDIEDRKTSVYDGTDGSFKDRLKLNDQTGDLTITDSKSKHSGLYQLKVSSNKQTLYKTFSVTVREAGLSSGGKAGLSFFFLLLIAAVIAAGWFLYRRRVSELQYEMKTVSVIEGKSVTLNTEMTEYDPKDHEIIWRFGDKGHMIAQIHGKTNDVSYVDDERFKNKLHLDKTTGDLTINDFTIRTSGDYHMEITRSTRINRFTTSKTFRVVVHVETLKVTEGKSVKLQTGISELQDDDQIQWRSETKDANIAVRNRKSDDEISINCDDDDEMFKNRLTLDHKTGSLTIRNMKNSDSGVYELQIKNKNTTSYKKFNVLVGYNTLKHTVGDSVTIKTGVSELKEDHQILWTFGNKNTRIAEINRASSQTYLYDGNDEIFRDRLKLNELNGDLIIRNIMRGHSDVYKLQINNRSDSTSKSFMLIVNEKLTEMSVMEGESVRLSTDLTDKQIDYEILWMFGPEENLIAKFHKKNNWNLLHGFVDEKKTLYDGVVGRFKNKLQLDRTGSLTIRDINAELTGLYKLQIISNRENTYKKYKVSLYVYTLKVTEGKSVELQSGISELQDDDQIQWRSETKDAIIAVRNGKSNDEISINCDDDEMFKNRLTLNNQTGSLTITNIENSDSGVYELQIKNRNTTSYKKFNVVVGYNTLKHTVGDSVTIKTGVSELMEDHQILWTFGDKNTRIAEINRVSSQTYLYDGNDEIFRDRLKLNELNGDLIIRNIIRGHSDVYKLQINSRSDSTSKSFMLTVNEKLKEMSVMEGESVTLSTDLTDIQGDYKIQWMFGPEENLIAKFHKKKKFNVIDEKKLYDVVDGRFKNKLHLDQTGSLTIKDIKAELTGLYKLQIITKIETKYKKYKVSLHGGERGGTADLKEVVSEGIPLLPIQTSQQQ